MHEIPFGRWCFFLTNVWSVTFWMVTLHRHRSGHTWTWSHTNDTKKKTLQGYFNLIWREVANGNEMQTGCTFIYTLFTDTVLTTSEPDFSLMKKNIYLKGSDVSLSYQISLSACYTIKNHSKAPQCEWLYPLIAVNSI